ncbi:serine hydrolase domain-containing protein [Microbacterium maritypicum]|uniref:serine hydrolase domain-containing protein n=1 Tax=Microbacterium maritypicum TaxID=33918 RepID=UPI003A93302E
MTASLPQILDDHVARGTAPGIVGVQGMPDGRVEIVASGDLRADAIVRIQSMTKPILAVAALRLVQEGRLRLDDPVERWLPELAGRRVLRTPEAALDDVGSAMTPITLRHLLTLTSGYGVQVVPTPLAEAMIANRTAAGQEPVAMGAQEWLEALAALPLAFEPGTGWRYHHSFGILGILLARVVDGPLEAHLQRDLFYPLGMVDTGYTVPLDKGVGIRRRSADRGGALRSLRLVGWAGNRLLDRSRRLVPHRAESSRDGPGGHGAVRRCAVKISVPPGHPERRVPCG